MPYHSNSHMLASCSQSFSFSNVHLSNCTSHALLQEQSHAGFLQPMNFLDLQYSMPILVMYATM